MPEKIGPVIMTPPDTMPDEVWMQIPGYEGHYEVSNLGHVRSLDRQGFHSRNKRKLRGRIMRQGQYSGCGYISVNLYLDKKSKRHDVHRLVAKAFLGDGGDFEVNHINHVRTDNRLENLEYVHNRVNQCHAQIVRGRLPGMTFRKRNKTNPWGAEIMVNGKKLNLGRYKTQEDAYQAYLKKAEEIGVDVAQIEKYRRTQAQAQTKGEKDGD